MTTDAAYVLVIIANYCTQLESRFKVVLEVCT